ncbi:serine hydrolase domain-containing protein [Jiella sonneratiae]|uniref:Serine hydrolase n=1 Tax=Jiella sonneratiae TaxID=2816856 RepID=A0ABS3J6L4_9HYPH|nr:serine hydrolase [Jiella sonneratiae]MBO0904613.1 serine hydrolase [Jiella sonneratiae]
MQETADGSAGDDGWPTARPEEAGMDAATLAGLAPQFEAWPEAKLHAALILRHGKVVYERYFAADDMAFAVPLGRVDYHAGLTHDLRSITKSITSLLIGAAIDRGLIADIDVSVFDFFPDHADLRSKEKQQITLRHLLTMSAGLEWNESIPYSDPANSERQMIEAADRCRYVLERPVVRPAGASYNYSGGTTMLLANVLKRVSGRPADELAREWLFDPLGIVEVEWVRYRDGTPMAASGLRMRPRDLAKIGQLVLDAGLWHGQRVVSGGWISESTRAHINGEGLFFYGYQWWLGRSLIKRREIRWIAGFGWGGQRLFVVPDHDLVVVVMAGLYGDPFLQALPGEVVLRRYALSSVISD